MIAVGGRLDTGKMIQVAVRKIVRNLTLLLLTFLFPLLFLCIGSRLPWRCWGPVSRRIGPPPRCQLYRL